MTRSACHNGTRPSCACTPSTSIKKSPGTAYSLRLHFSENSLAKSGARKFDVIVNGAKVLSAFDVFASAGGKNTAVVKAFNTTASAGGQIVVSFTGVTPAQPPIINGLEVDR